LQAHGGAHHEQSMASRILFLGFYNLQLSHSCLNGPGEKDLLFFSRVKVKSFADNLPAGH